MRLSVRDVCRPVRLFLFCALLLAPWAAGLAPAMPASAMPAAAGLLPPGPGAAAGTSMPAQPFFAPSSVPSHANAPSAAPAGCDTGNRNGYAYWICMPTRLLGGTWNPKDLIVFAHGYVGPDQPIAVPEDQLTVNYNGFPVSLIDIVNGMYNSLLGLNYHYAFAVTSYSVNGLAVQQGKAEVADLANYFKTLHPDTRNVYLIGASEGGLITALSVEQAGAPFNGGLAICGPIGDFNMQTNYFGDFRVVFDYYFRGLIPGTPMNIPPDLINQAAYNNLYQNTILPAIQKPAAIISLTQLFNVVHAPPYDPTTYQTTVQSVLYYSILATMDAATKLGGNPYDNHDRVYAGSGSAAVDAAINNWVTAMGYRYTASPAALANINATLQTTGIPLTPLVTAHTTLDQEVPYSHEALYHNKVASQGKLRMLDQFTVNGYGHCAIDPTTFQQALARLELRVNGSSVYLPLLKR